MFRQTSASLVLRGILAVIAGIVAIAWPGLTVYALVVEFVGGQQCRSRKATIDTATAA